MNPLSDVRHMPQIHQSSYAWQQATCIQYAMFALVALCAFFFFLPDVHAANRYWVGTRNAVSDRWEHPENWSTLPRGLSGASVPGVNDVAIFSFSGTTVRIRSTAAIKGLVMSNVWTGSIIQGTGALVVKNDTNGIRIGSGRLIGGAGAITMGTGSFVMTGGIVSGISSLTMSGNLSITNGGGTGIPNANFTSQTGTLIFDSGTADQTLTVGSSTTGRFGALTLQLGAGSTDDDLTISGNLLLSGALTITTGNLDLSTNNAALNVEGGITIANAAQATLISDGNITSSGSIAVGASGHFLMSGSTTLTLNGHDQLLDTNNIPIYNLTIASSSGTTLWSNTSVTNAVTINSGVNLGISGHTLYATGTTIANSGTISEQTGGTNAENSGKIVHTATSFVLADSAYSAKTSYVAGAERVYITITDSDENINGAAIDTVTVTGSLASGDVEVISLGETSVASGIFRASIETAVHGSPTSRNSVLEISTSATTLSMSFVDVQDQLSNSASASFGVPDAGTSSSSSSGGGGGGGGGGSRRTSPPALNEGSRTTESSSGGSSTPSDGGAGDAVSVSVDGRTVTFRDLHTNDWFTPFVQNLLEMNIVSGYRDARGNPTGEYGPANSVTYAEIAKMGLNAAGVPTVSGSPENRSAKGQWSANFIATMEQNGISVFSNTAVDVNKAAPRGAVVQTILESFGVAIPSSAQGGIYSDLSASTKHAAAIEKATADGIVSGDDGKDTFRPSDPVNRAEVAKIVGKAMEVYGGQ